MERGGRPCCAALTLIRKESETQTDREQIVLLQIERERLDTAERGVLEVEI